MIEVIVKLYFCVETNSYNKVFENMISDIYFFYLKPCQLPPAGKMFVFGIENTKAKYQ